MLSSRTRTESLPKVSITRLAINWIPRSSATATSEGFTFTFNGNYLARYVRQATPADRKLNFDNRFAGPRLGSLPRNRWYTSLFYDGPPGSWLGGLDAGATVHYIGQYQDGFFHIAKSVNGRHWIWSSTTPLICLLLGIKRSRRICQGRRQEHEVQRRQGKERHAGLYSGV